MATVPFPGVWSPDVQFTGNSSFALDSHGTIWLVGNSTVTGDGLYSSTNNGASFTLAATIPSAFSLQIAFDPAIAIDANGVIHILGQVGVTESVSLQKYSYNPSSQTLSGPFSIATNGLVGSDYDIVCLANGHCYIATATLTAATETVEGVEIDATGAIVSTDPILTQGMEAGNRYGSVSLWTPDGVTVEIYLCYNPKLYTLANQVITFALITRTSPGVLTAPVILHTLVARYISDKLTVIGNGNERWLSQGFYSQSKASLIGNVLLGQGIAGAWNFQVFSGTVAASIIQPTLSLSPDGAVLGYISGSMGVTLSEAGERILLFDVNPTGWVLTPRSDFLYPVLATWLRGSKSILPVAMIWGFLAQSVGGVGRFYTGLQQPPVAILTPSAETCQRGIEYVFDASTSYDPNMGPLTFSWVLTDPTELATLTPTGSSAEVIAPSSIGPAAVAMTLTVTVTKGSGASLMTGTAASTLSYPLIVPPTIAASPTLAAARNSLAQLIPTVTVSPFVEASYSWTQTTGTTMTIVPGTAEEEDLSFQTNGALVAGETLTFTLSVSDGLNAAVIGIFSVAVAARPATGETEYFASSSRAGNMSQRNSVQTWAAPQPTALLTGFTRAVSAPVIGATTGSLLMIGPLSVGVSMNGGLFRVLTPNPTDTILDAALYALDQMIVLTSAQELLQFLPTATIRDTDNAAKTIALFDYTVSPYTRFIVTPPFAGQRVFILYGVDGVLLLQVDDTFAVTGALELSAARGYLYGATNVDFVRYAGVESLRSGTLLIGTSDTAGNDYETVFSLANRAVIATLDASQVGGESVSTGELLFLTQDSYSGVPVAPVLLEPTATASGIQLTWTQPRPDLVTGYVVSVAGTGSPYTLTVRSGFITSIPINNLLPDTVYTYSVTAQSLDGPSAPSNTVMTG